MRINLVFMAHLEQHRQIFQARALICACAIVVALAGCASMEPTVPAETGVAFSLPLGKTAAINGSGTRITFHRVRDDSRCPTDVTCVWAGDARIEVTVSRSGAPDDPKVLGLNPPDNEATSGDLRIRFVGLTPVPRQSDQTPREYVAQLVVTRP